MPTIPTPYDAELDELKTLMSSKMTICAMAGCGRRRGVTLTSLAESSIGRSPISGRCCRNTATDASPWRTVPSAKTMPRYLKDPKFKSGSDPKVEKRRAWFVAFNREAMGRGDAWITSTPNSDVCRIEVTPGSAWVAELQSRGYPIEPDEPAEGQRILGHGVRETVHVNIDGTVLPVTEGSTMPTETIDHAGIIKVVRYRFRAP